MMLILLCLILTIVGVVLWVVRRYEDDILSFIGVVMTLLFGVILLISVIVLAANNQDYKATYNQLQAQEEVLIIQYETAKESGNFIVVSEIYKLVMEHNNVIIEHQTHIDSIWVGAFYSRKIAGMKLINIKGDK